ncbi:MAG TPA: VTT domain-containing protein [Dehalococcoidales bacterium]|nr:VTT domain-containing protein [Dehalococcoidales bacterium]
MGEASGKINRWVPIVIIALTVIISVGGAILLVFYRKYLVDLESQGYLGLFIISLFAGSPIPIPTPSMILTFTLGSILNPFFVGLVSGIGNAAGNALIFWTGRGGNKIFRNFIKTGTPGKPARTRIGRLFQRLSRVPEFVSRRAMVAVFVLAIYPNPILTPLILGMGAWRSSFWSFFLAVWAGKTVQALILSYLGYFGLRSLLRFFGVF